MSDNERTVRPSSWRLGSAVVLGAAAALSGPLFGMPGRGEFVAVIWVAAVLALLVAPGWAGFAAFLAGVIGCAVVIDVSDGVFGLVLLIVVVVSAIAAHAALTASIALRWRALGLRAGTRDRRVLLGGGLALGTALVFVWFAGEFARNPP